MNIQEVTDKLNPLRPLELGDPVMHKPTRLNGYVEALETQPGIDATLVTVRLESGKVMRGLRREEFALHHFKPAIQFAMPTAGASPALEKLEGAISAESILDQIE